MIAVDKTIMCWLGSMVPNVWRNAREGPKLVSRAKQNQMQIWVSRRYRSWALKRRRRNVNRHGRQDTEEKLVLSFISRKTQGCLDDKRIHKKLLGAVGRVE